MFEKVLVANRGEIAIRIMRTLREMGIGAIGVYSEADRDAPHVRAADEGFLLGPAVPAESYLAIPKLIEAAQRAGAKGIHPGYGFLAENAEFAEICERSGLVFIGPTADQIRRMGDKAEARRTMIEAGVPVVPGSKGALESAEEARTEAERIGYPVIVKAAAGGGGKGMRVAESADEIENTYTMARNEAAAAFNDARVYLERFVDRPRHVEIQILGDRHGNVVHLGERDCSVQRRHQKLIEEAPSPALTPELRAAMGEAAVRAAAAIGYSNAGTVEFLLSADGSFYFMEMNTRIQVEHPVTEVVTGVDLVKEQIRSAAGIELRLSEPPELRGHAIELRINAEDPEKDFRPSPGTITAFHAPGGPGIRIDTHVYAGYRVPQYYDSLLGKLIAQGSTRQEAIGRALQALEEFIVEGVHTTIPFLSSVLRHPEFAAGRVDTGFLARMKDQEAAGGPVSD